MADYISERTGGQIIGDSLRLYLNNLPVIFAVYVLPLLPFIFIEAVALSEGDAQTNLIASLIDAIISIFTLGAVTIAVSDICLGNKASLVRSYAALFRVFWAYLGVYLLYLLATFLGLVLLIVPGIVAMLLLVFCLPAAVVERRGPIEAFKRSIELGKGYYWRNFGVLLLAVLVAMVAMVVVVLVMVFFSVLFNAGPESFALNFFTGFLTALAVPLFQVPAILLYYDMRARKEHFDGSALAQELMT